MIPVKNPLFKLGQVVATPGSGGDGAGGSDAVGVHGAACCRELGRVCAEDAEFNNQSLKDGSRILSAYILKDGQTKLWVITEAEDDKATERRPRCSSATNIRRP